MRLFVPETEQTEFLLITQTFSIQCLYFNLIRIDTKFKLYYVIIEKKRWASSGIRPEIYSHVWNNKSAQVISREKKICITSFEWPYPNALTLITLGYAILWSMDFNLHYQQMWKKFTFILNCFDVFVSESIRSNLKDISFLNIFFSVVPFICQLLDGQILMMVRLNSIFISIVGNREWQKMWLYFKDFLLMDPFEFLYSSIFRYIMFARCITTHFNAYEYQYNSSF